MHAITADMPNVLPKDMAMAVKSAMKTLTMVLRRLCGAGLDRTWPQGELHSRAEGSMVRTWWEKLDGTVTQKTLPPRRSHEEASPPGGEEEDSVGAG